jgi:hypothetical protein
MEVYLLRVAYEIKLLDWFKLDDIWRGPTPMGLPDLFELLDLLLILGSLDLDRLKLFLQILDLLSAPD